MKKFLIVFVSIACLFITIAIVRNRSLAREHFHAEAIAHGGGVIDGHIYSNSLEAAETALRNGAKMIEFDLVLTADSQLVASHGWDLFRMHTAFSSITPPNLSQLTDLKIDNTYTIVTSLTIDSLLAANPNLTLVTDQLSNPTIIERHFAKYKNRTIIEAFGLSDYFELRDKDFDGAAYSGINMELVLAELKYMFGLTDRRVERLVLSTSSYPKYHKYLSWWFTPKKIYLWGVSADYYKQHYESNGDVAGLYLDDVTDLK